MSAHTPGPWHWEAGGTSVDPETYRSPGLYDNLELVAPGGVYVLSADGGTYPMLKHAADARAIALVPEMVAALRTLVASNYGQPSGVTVPALDAARALLARLDSPA